MGKLVEFQLEDGGTVVVETDEPEAGGMQQSGRERKVELASKTYEQALDQVMPAAERTAQRLQGLSWRPGGVAVEFGIKFGVKSGAIIASTAIDANLKVTVTWGTDAAPAPDPAEAPEEGDPSDAPT